MQIFTTHDVFKEAKTLLQNDFNQRRGNLSEEHKSVNFRSICRGERLLPEIRIAEQLCYLENTNHPYFYINPLKIEVNSWQPLVYQVHDFVSWQTVSDLSMTVVPSMVSLHESEAPWQKINADQTFSHYVLPDSATTTLSTLTFKVSLLPGRNMFQTNSFPSDSYIISAYAVGNHYEPCTNCFMVNYLYLKFEVMM